MLLTHRVTTHKNTTNFHEKINNNNNNISSSQLANDTWKVCMGIVHFVRWQATNTSHSLGPIMLFIAVCCCCCFSCYCGPTNAHTTTETTKLICSLVGFTQPVQVAHPSAPPHIPCKLFWWQIFRSAISLGVLTARVQSVDPSTNFQITIVLSLIPATAHKKNGGKKQNMPESIFNWHLPNILINHSAHSAKYWRSQDKKQHFSLESCHWCYFESVFFLLSFFARWHARLSLCGGCMLCHRHVHMAELKNSAYFPHFWRWLIILFESVTLYQLQFSPSVQSNDDYE